MNKNIRIIVAAHKPYRMPEDEMYLPVQVGAALEEDIGFQRDDEGENISELNPFFCELTGLYWAWKNLDADYIGLVHYRRHFSRHRKPDKWQSILKKKDIENDLDFISVFVPKKRRYWIETLYSHYKHTHYIKQLDETRSIIAQDCPEYLNAFDKTVKQRWGYMFNMMIMEKLLLNEYCTWVFDILFTLRNRLGEDGLNAFHSRYYGRIGEIIFNVWLNRKIENGEIERQQIRELPYMQMERINWAKKGMAFLEAKFFGKKYEGNF